MIRKRKNKSKNAYVIFTREPVPGLTKTRLMPYYTAEECAELHKCFLRDIAREMKGGDFDIIVAYTGGEPLFLKETFGRKACYTEQRGDDLGKKMENAFRDAFSMGYERVVLTGSDIPELEKETIETAFAMLGTCDVVMGPTADGGYYLAGMKEPHYEAFGVKTYGVSTVFEETVRSIREAGSEVAVIDEYNDIDTKEDLLDLRRRAIEDAGMRRSHTARFINDRLKISVIIPTYNEETTVAAMEEQLKAFTYGRDDTEIIYVDGGSTDRTVSMVGSGHTLLSCGKGRGAQLNFGALRSSGDVLFFLHCDSVLPENFIDEIKQCMRKHLFGCFGVKFPSRNFFMLTNRIISNHRALVRGLPFGDQGIFIDRGLFFETGMFPELPLMEDYVYSMKLRRYGIRPGMTSRRILTSARRYGTGTGRVLRTEFMMWNLRRLYRKGRNIEELAEMYEDIR